MSLNDFLQGKRILEERDSEFNGKLTVVQDFLFGTYIMGGGLPQSGGLAEEIWKTTFKEITKEDVKTALILGLGGGGIVKALFKKYPYAKITGVDIDPVIVELGQKYFGWSEKNVEVKIDDVENFVNNQIKKISTKGRPASGWDFILLDTYQGENFPEKFTSEKFLKRLKKMLNKNGILVANRLYGQEDMAAARKFGQTLSKIFPKIEKVYPEANIMFVCSD